MEENGHDRLIRILNRALQMLQQCKVPKFHPTSSDPNELQRMQRAWSQGLVNLLPQMLNYVEAHRNLIFDEDFGPITREVRKHFVLVFFEQSDGFFERADFQLRYELTSEVDSLLTGFVPEVLNVLRSKRNLVVQNLLFHYYGTELAMEGWRSRPGDTYGFVRLCKYLILKKSDSKTTYFESRMFAFAEKLGIELLCFKANFEYQVLGLSLLERIMRAAVSERRTTTNAEDILMLVLRLILKRTPLEVEPLWNLVYYAARLVPVKNPYLDDELMRMLVSSVVEDSEFDVMHVMTLTRILLLDIPEAEVYGDFFLDKLSISGRECEFEEFCNYVITQLDHQIECSALRISTCWRIRVGQLIPNLLPKVVDYSNLWTHTGGLDCFHLLLRVSLFPIQRSGWQLRSRLQMYCSLLNGIFPWMEHLRNTLERRLALDDRALQDELRSEDVDYTELHLNKELRKILQSVRNASVDAMPSKCGLCFVSHDRGHNFGPRYQTLTNELKFRLGGSILLVRQIGDVVSRYADRLELLQESEEMQQDEEDEEGAESNGV